MTNTYVIQWTDPERLSIYEDVVEASWGEDTKGWMKFYDSLGYVIRMYNKSYIVGDIHVCSGTD